MEPTSTSPGRQGSLKNPEIVENVPGHVIPISVRIPVATLRTILAVVLIGSGLGLLTKAGVGVPAGVLAALPVAVALLAAVVRRRRKARSGPGGSGDARAARPAET